MCKNVNETWIWKIQFITDEHAFPAFLVQREYISEFLAQGIGLLPDVKKQGIQQGPEV